MHRYMLVRRVDQHNLQQGSYDVLVNGTKVARWTSGVMYDVTADGITLMLMRWLISMYAYTTKRTCELQLKGPDGQWKFYSYLIYGADERGKYGPAAQAWADAKVVIKQQPDQWRVIEYTEET